MSIPLPPEIFDLIVEHLCEERATLKVCSVVSKSWVPRARRHLFASVEIHHIFSPLELWVKAFPDPSNSPAHHTRELSLGGPWLVSAAGRVAHAWIRAFCNIVNLTVETNDRGITQASLAPIHAISSSLKSLRLFHFSIPPSEVFSLICSFPSLEDLALRDFGRGETDTSALSSTSPKFTGTLSLEKTGGVRFDIRPLLALPGGLHFIGIFVECLEGDFESISRLVSACRNTLEILCINIIQSSSDTSPISARLDLSKATNLKGVVFEVRGPSVRWILTSLQTVESKNLQQITIQSRGEGLYEILNIEEEFLREWRDLDRLLVQFWTSRSIRLNLVDEMKRLKALTPMLLPELTRRGLLDVV